MTYKVANIHDAIFHWMSAVDRVSKAGLLLLAFTCGLGLASSFDVLQIHFACKRQEFK